MTSVTMTDVTIDGATVRCPGRGAASVPRRLTLMTSGATVHATCGERHAPAPGDRRAQCFFPVEHITAATVAALGAARPGRVRATLPGGRTLTGKVVATAGRSASTGPSTTAAGKAAAAVAAKTGRVPAAGPPRPRGGGGGAFTAAMNAVAAVAGAVGQTAGAAGQIAGAGASVVGSVSSVAREGLGVKRDAGRAEDRQAQRRHARDLRDADHADRREQRKHDRETRAAELADRREQRRHDRETRGDGA